MTITVPDCGLDHAAFTEPDRAAFVPWHNLRLVRVAAKTEKFPVHFRLIEPQCAGLLRNIDQVQYLRHAEISQIPSEASPRCLI